MESGGEISEITKVLESATAGALPQPVSYLLQETARRFGSLKVITANQTEIVSEDQILLTQISNEKSLAHLSLKNTDGCLTTAASQELCYFSLRAAGYPAVMIDQEGRIISPRFSSPAAELTNQSELLARALALQSGERAIADQGDVARQLEFAIKNKLQVQVKIDINGTLTELLLTPLGLANNRLRGRDEAKQAERTLPLARISSVVLS